MHMLEWEQRLQLLRLFDVAQHTNTTQHSVQRKTAFHVHAAEGLAMQTCTCPNAVSSGPAAGRVHFVVAVEALEQRLLRLQARLRPARSLQVLAACCH